MKVYVKPWCPWCIDALAWLDKRGYQHEKVDVMSNAEAFRHMKSISGQSLTPTLETPDGLVLADFDTAQLEKFLSAHKITPE